MTVETNESDRPQPRQRRRLVAILHADIVAYSRHMGRDEAGTHARLVALHDDIVRAAAERGGRVVGTAGDAWLVDFPSVVDALDAAVAIQGQAARRNAGLSGDTRLELRIGINLGDVIDDGGNLFGDGVNVAERVQALADPGGIAVSSTVQEQAHNKLPLRFEDRGSHAVKNIAEPVHVYAVLPDGATARPPRRRWRLPALLLALLLLAGGAALWTWLPLGPEPTAGSGASILSGKPTVAVLPFEDRSPGTATNEETWFGDGITEDVIAQLGRFSSLYVLSWSAVAPYRDTAVTPEALSEALGVRYVVGGSLTRSAGRLQIRVQLTDAERGVLLWSDRMSVSMEDVFAMQDALARQIVGALAVRVTDVERERVSAKPTESLDAYDHLLRGRDLLQKVTRTANYEARRMFERAVALDPGYAGARVGLGWTHVQDFLYGWSERPWRSLETARGLAETAVALDRESADAHALLAFVLRSLGEHDAARRHIDTALAINPNDPQSLAIHGNLLLQEGWVEEAVQPLELAIRLDPNPRAFWLFTLSGAYYFLERYEDAVALLNAHVPGFEEDPALFAVLAAAEAQLGRVEDAARSVATLRRYSPFFDADRFAESVVRAPQQQHLREGLRKAGL